MLRYAGLVVAAALFAAAASGCENPEPGIGLELAADGSGIIVYHKPCRPDTTILGIRLTDEAGVVYEASSAAGEPVRQFKLGEPLPGFVESVPFDRDFLSLNVLRLSLRTSELPDEYVNFTRGDLRIGELFVRYRGYMTREEFEAHSSCSGRGLLG